MLSHFRLSADNLPEICMGLPIHCNSERPELKDWGQPYWDILISPEGAVEVHACRPTEAEIYAGDLHGELGSVITPKHCDRNTIKNALRLARLLGKADPGRGLYVKAEYLLGIAKIETQIDIYICYTVRRWVAA